jgi:Uma2 family endonuclease
VARPWDWRPFDVVFSFHDVVEPDLVFVAPGQLDILTDKNIQGAPALVVEILSSSTRRRDEQLKRRLYERTGVREYWLVNPTAARSSSSGGPRMARSHRWKRPPPRDTTR